MKKLCLLFALMLFFSFPAAADDYFSLLLIGEDTAGQPEAGATAYGSADALIVVSVSLDSGAISMLSIDRLLAADVTGAGEMPLNMVNPLGGPELQMRTVNSLFSLDIDTYMMVDRSIMGDLVGIAGNVVFNVSDEDLLLTFPDGSSVFSKTGIQPISGMQAVALMESNGDYSDERRNQRQRDVLIAIVNKILANPDFDVIFNLAVRIIPMVDTNISMSDIVTAAVPVIMNGFSEPRQMRTPETGLSATLNGFLCVRPQDIAAERMRVRAFLYGGL